MTVNISTDLDIPTLEEIRATRDRIDPHIVRTPVWRWQSEALAEALGPGTEVWLKLELFQKTGTFKPRGAVNDLLQLGEAAKERGVTAVSAGNHAIAVAYAAQIFGCDAKVVMPESAPVFRVDKARSYGAEVVLVADVYAAFAEVERIQQEEGRAFIHPFRQPPDYHRAGDGRPGDVRGRAAAGYADRAGGGRRPGRGHWRGLQADAT